MSQEIQQLQNEVTRLKSRAYDLTELIGQKQEELNNYATLMGHICQVLGIDGSQGVTPDAIIGAIRALAEPVPEDAEPKEPEEQLLQE